MKSRVVQALPPQTSHAATRCFVPWSADGITAEDRRTLEPLRPITLRRSNLDERQWTAALLRSRENSAS